MQAKSTLRFSKGRKKTIFLRAGAIGLVSFFLCLWSFYAAAHACEGYDCGDIGIIRVYKISPEDHGKIFEFNTDFGDFFLSHGQRFTVEIAPGQYAIAEKKEAGWGTDSIICWGDDIDNSVIDQINGSVVINLDAWEDIECEFVNKPETVTEKKGSIEVCKFEDLDGLASTTDDRATSTIAWQFNLSDGTSSTVSQITSGGCTVFSGLKADTYTITETLKSGWNLVEPADNKIIVDLKKDETENIEFVNHKPEPPANGGNGNGGGGNGGGGNGGGGGGGGGGYMNMDLMLMNEQAHYTDGIFTVTWLTNKPATSRVLYDTVPHPDAASGEAPNYGYAWSTELDETKVTGHSVTISGLSAGVTYYFRPVSSASPEKLGKEVNAGEGTAAVSGPVVVLGEAGGPALTLEKTIDKDSANPGDKNIKYTLTVTNTGSLAAINTVLTDTLSDGLSFADSETMTKTWDIGDIAAGDTMEFIYFVNVDAAANPAVYTDTASVSADNNEAVEAGADLEVKAVVVLAETGFSLAELFYLLLAAISLAGVSSLLRKKEEVAVVEVKN